MLFKEIKVRDGWTFPVDAGFPTVGFKGATFTLVPKDTTATYTWSSDTEWVSVDNQGTVTLTDAPSHAELVTLTAVSGVIYITYSFFVTSWFDVIPNERAEIKYVTDTLLGNPDPVVYIAFNKVVESFGCEIADYEFITSKNIPDTGKVGTLLGEWYGQFKKGINKEYLVFSNDQLIQGIPSHSDASWDFIWLSAPLGQSVISQRLLPDSFGILCVKNLRGFQGVQNNNCYTNIDSADELKWASPLQWMHLKTPESPDNYDWHSDNSTVHINPAGSIVLKYAGMKAATIKAKHKYSHRPALRYHFTVTRWRGINNLKIPTTQEASVVVLRKQNMWSDEGTEYLDVPPRTVYSGIGRMAVCHKEALSFCQNLPQQILEHAQCAFVPWYKYVNY